MNPTPPSPPPAATTAADPPPPPVRKPYSPPKLRHLGSVKNLTGTIGEGASTGAARRKAHG